MKTKQEILNSYSTQSPDGSPEISANDLLSAMEEYSKQAFEAARIKDANTYSFTNYDGYLSALIKNTTPAEEDNIRFIADSILPQFLPNDPNAQTLSFELKTNGQIYTANYTKSADGYWQFSSYDTH